MKPVFQISNERSNTRKIPECLKKITGWMVLLLLVFVASGAWAAAQRDQALENEIQRRLENIAPPAADYFIKATQAMDNGDKKTAREDFKRVLEYAPDFVPAIRRMSYVVNDPKEMLRLAKKAYALNDHFYNTQAVVYALLKQKTINEAETNRYLRHLMTQAPDDFDSQCLICQASLQIGQADMLKKAVTNLKRLAPEEITTHYYAGIEAAFDERWGEAEREILKAQELGLPANVTRDILEKTGIRSHARRWRLLAYAGYGLAVWAAGLMLLLIIGMLLSKLTLITIEKGSDKIRNDEKGGMYLIRRIYAAVLGLTSFYFYISIPIVLLLVIATGGGVIYSFFMIGRIPIKLVLIIAGVVCVTVYGMIKSLFIRVQDKDPGPRLSEADAPSFFNALQEVASQIDAPMVDSVFIVQDTTVAVFERGSFWKRLNRKTNKCLILGLGLLNGLTQVQLKSILAHEFGHISNRDTAGGSIALHVRRSIYASAKAMAEGGAAAWYNPAWLFIKSFYRIFLRVSQGASRLQEVLADQWAALVYGPCSFVQGLKHAIKRSIEYEFVSNFEINQAILERRHLKNLYSLEVPGQWPESGKSGNENENEEKNFSDPDLTPEEKVAAAVEEAMNEKTSPFNSHPAPMQRIRWIEALQNVPDVEDDGRSAWDLLENAKELQDLMTNEIDARVQEYIENT
jgi:Zn-dependent protease with chaperone function